MISFLFLYLFISFRKKSNGRGLSQMPFRSKMKRMAASTPGSTVFTESTIAKNPGQRIENDEKMMKK